MENKWLEPSIKSYKEYFGNTANIIFDIGTRDGHDAHYFSENLNAKEVYTFDPNPIAFEQTNRNYPGFKNFELAISDYDGDTQFTQIISNNPDEAGCSSINVIHTYFDNVRYATITASVSRLDTFIENNNLQNKIIDVIKIDTEGFSWQVLQGMGKYINNVKMFHIETETFFRHDGHRNNIEIEKLMSDNNFVCVNKSYQWGSQIEDQLWINNKLVGEK